MKSICVFCGSNFGTDPAFEQAARETGRVIAEAGKTLVYGGAAVGLMGAVADGALAAGGKVIGILPEALKAKELEHKGLSEIHIVRSMHERKAMFAELSDGFITLPGGTGTMEEIFEVWTWGQLGYHSKPFGLLNTARFYDALLTFLDEQVSKGFVRAEMRSMLLVSEDPAHLIAGFEAYVPPVISKWIKKQDT
ncbi:LOG family protein yvdD [Pannonibacter phragmitetus]|uniref:Cytokinin riboside 5'-monophosphate phosphoribohydrolase n=1 Tax=Pannonibacter phragmitetus TaxID=121719 RepID=A0A378ZSX0_9HYPH|nr:TIGR00730 family Rossman fold protein [Pannonibacter phragmitetus]SUB00168.1 LOG family protein yvdD [Pannonibacter phragmitetus]